MFYAIAGVLISIVWILCLIAFIFPTPQLALDTRNKAFLALAISTTILLGFFDDNAIPSAKSPRDDPKALVNLPKPEGYPGFQARLAAGADCPELFEIRNEVKREDPSSADRMNEDLRSIGCYSSSSSRTSLKEVEEERD